MKNIHQKILLDIIKARPKDHGQFLILKKKFSGQYGLAPVTNATLIEAWRQIKTKNLSPYYLTTLLPFFTKRATRTLSGVTPITVLTKPYACPGQCIYCPNEPGMPKSYLSNEPAAQRAKALGFNPAKQTTLRIKALEANGHQVDKIELLILGGCFNAYPKKYQEDFIKKCFIACNHKKTKKQKNKETKNLVRIFKNNETAKYRIIGVTIETRPDLINEDEIKWFRKLGVTRVQLGVQHLDDKILKLVKRGHNTKQTIEATKLLKQAGFKIDYHLMPDLPGSTPQKDLKMFQQLFTDQNFQPDQIKIYPTVVNEYAPLKKWLKSGKYKPYTPYRLIALLAKVKLTVPYYVRINRLIRDIPKESIMAGNKITNLRQFLQNKLKKDKKECKCIRCREVKENIADFKNAKLFNQKYRASKAIEYFVSFESPKRDQLYSFLRLRINDDKNIYIPELNNAAIVRELHTYGQLVTVTDRSGKGFIPLPVKNSTQHTGFGKKLMKIAEDLTLKHGLKKIAVISGIGVRPYYRKLGYKLQGTYMVKHFTNSSQMAHPITRK